LTALVSWELSLSKRPTYYANEDCNTPHVELASIAICSCRCNKLNGDAGDKVERPPKCNVRGVECQLAGGWVFDGSVLVDEALIGDNATNN